jgi:transcription initiation factor TFIIIB Brf1 subunit/transcription initiation factor TFIIB
MNHRDRALFHAYKSIEGPAEMIGVSAKTIRDAKIMYRKFNADKLTRGAVRTGIKANCIFYACKMSDCPRTTKEIADAFGIPTKDISRTTDLFRDTMFPKVSSSIPNSHSESSITTPRDVIGRVINNFNIDNRRKIQSDCNKLADKLEDCVALMGKTPLSVAAVIVMKVMGDDVTKQIIVEKCSVSLPTINKIESLINKHLEV